MINSRSSSSSRKRPDASREWYLVKTYDPLLVPGLFQTDDYARAVIRAHNPDWDREEIERKVELRLQRTRLLDDTSGPKIWAIIGEAALRTSVGSADTMVRQLLHLLAMADHPRATVQVLPFSAGAHAGMEGCFAVLEYADLEDSTVAYMDRPAGSSWVEKPNEVDRVSLVFNHIQAAASPVDESAETIRKILSEMGDDRADVAQVEPERQRQR
ncbi:MAG TPA: DUF5753 domain-containing protein [Actinocatenispora sp.]